MITHPRRLIDFLAEHNMTEHQFLLCWLHYLDHEDYKGFKYPEEHHEGQPMARIYQYLQKVGGFDRDEIHDLIERGYLINTHKGSGIYPEELRVTDKFINEVIATVEDFEFFLDAYPDYVDNFNNPQTGKKIPLKACDIEKAERIFLKKVKSKPEFERLMEAVEFGVENDLIVMNVVNFLSGQYWRPLLERKKEGKTDKPLRRPMN